MTASNLGAAPLGHYLQNFEATFRQKRTSFEGNGLPVYAIFLVVPVPVVLDKPIFVRRRPASHLIIETKPIVISRDQVFRIAVGCRHISHKAVIFFTTSPPFAGGDPEKGKKASQKWRGCPAHKAAKKSQGSRSTA